MILWLRGYTRDTLEPYSQVQGAHASGCGPFSMAMAINLLSHRTVWNGADAEAALEKNRLKLPRIGIPPWFQPRAVKKLAPGMKTRLFTHAAQANLLACLADGCPALVTVSWETTGQMIQKAVGAMNGKPGPVVGHVIVLVGYDYFTRVFYFLDPGNQGVTGYSEADFERYWHRQPNWFIPGGSMLRVSL
jgi:hypothetical protein